MAVVPPLCYLLPGKHNTSDMLLSHGADPSEQAAPAEKHQTFPVDSTGGRDLLSAKSFMINTELHKTTVWDNEMHKVFS